MQNYDFKTYNELFKHITDDENPTFLNYLQNGKFESLSIDDFKHKVICLTLALIDLGVKPNDKIGIFAKSSPFWLIFDFAIHQIGAVSVPIFANISTINLNFEIADSKMKYMFIDSQERVNDIEKVHKDLIFITHNFCIKEPNFHNFDEILVIGKQICDAKGFQTFDVKEDDTFSIIYTSGNTGTPKGVVLTHKNIITQLKDINSLVNLSKDEISLSVLPLAHIFERTVMSYYLSRKISIYFVDDVQNVANLLKIVKPTIMSVVPRLVEKIYYKIKSNISEKSFIAKFLGGMAFKYAHKENINKNSILYKIYDAILYKKLREIFGSRVSKLISGGAYLSKDIALFFNNINIPLYQGYGLTEFSPVISTNYPNANKIGSCGKILPSAKVKISQNSEILVSGNSLMKGYLNQEELTKQTIDEDGWLHTGDMGYIDEDGYLYVKNRVKEIFKTSTGEYVNAIAIEQELSKSRYIEFAVVISQNKKYTTALLFVDKDRFEQMRKTNPDLTIEKFYNQESVLKSINTHINNLNNKLNVWEKVVKYKLITNPISIEGGELTPSMKICRSKIEEKYEDIIKNLYEES